MTHDELKRCPLGADSDLLTIAYMAGFQDGKKHTTSPDAEINCKCGAAFKLERFKK